MALTNPLLAVPVLSSSSTRIKYTVGFAEMAKLGAFTTGAVVLETLPAGAVIKFTRVKHSAALVGPSISAGTARVVTSLNPGAVASLVNSYGAAALDIFAAPGTTSETHFKDHYQGGTIGSAAGLVEAFAVATDLMLSLTCTGANFSVVTAGSVDVWIEYIVVGL